MDELFATCGLVLLPATPVARLAADADHSKTRGEILRYTTPFSMAGVPVVTLPCTAGGMQLAAARGCDESLVEFAAQLGAHRNSAASAARLA
jgi:aspartyl-tRNA(Asn)/glutamyl-tRNA(Gln) amidotransferase subunit A